MGLKEAFIQRAERVVTRQIAGVGPVQIKRLTWDETKGLSPLDAEKLTAAVVLDDAGIGPFFSDASAVKACDAALAVALIRAAQEVNGLADDPADAEKS